MEIILENLTKVFTDKKSKSETIAVNDVTLTIPSGKLVGLLGPSGCGKSTTLYMIAGLLKPTNGRILFGEDDVTDLAPEKRGIGLVFQNYALYPHMTILQNIMFPLINLKVPKVEAKELATEMAKLVGIEDQLGKKPGQLSGGQQQRVAIARALVKKPKVLLLDEPLSNLDARLRLQTREEIKRIQRETGITTIFVTHDQEEAMSISDEIVLMEKGFKKQVGGPQYVYNNPGNLFAAKFLGTPPVNLYKGEIKKNSLYIGKTKVASAIADFNCKYQGDVTVAVRPEGYIPNKNGILEVPYSFVETIGRDLVLVANHPDSIQDSFRIVLNEAKDITKDSVKFDLNPEKVHLFVSKPAPQVVAPVEGEELAEPIVAKDTSKEEFKDGDLVEFIFKNSGRTAVKEDAAKAVKTLKTATKAKVSEIKTKVTKKTSKKEGGSN